MPVAGSKKRDAPGRLFFLEQWGTHRFCKRYLLHTSGLIGAKPFSQYFIDIINDDKCVGVYLLDPFFQFYNLIPGKSTQKHLMALVGKTAFTVQQCNTAIHFQQCSS